MPSWDRQGRAKDHKEGKTHGLGVWVPPVTGTDIGSRWVEVDDNGNGDTGADSAQKVDKVDASTLEKLRATMPNSGRGSGGQ